MKPIILWRQSDGTLGPECPGQSVASTVSEAALRRLALDGQDIFVLELYVDSQTDDWELHASRMWRGSDKHLEIWQKKQEAMKNADDTEGTNGGAGPGAHSE